MSNFYSLYPTTSASGVAATPTEMAPPPTPTSLATRGRSSTSTSSVSFSKGSASGSKRDSRDSKASVGWSRKDWMEAPLPVGVTIGGKERVPQAVALLAPAFVDNPLNTYLLNSLDPVDRRAFLPKYFTALLTQASLNGGYIFEHSNWESCMIVLPPGKGVGNPFTLLQSGLAGLLRKVGLTCVKRMLGEFEGAAKKSRKVGLAKGEVPYYVFFIGTRADRQGRGLGTALMEEVCERAGREGRSVWIESTSEGSARLFRRLGFVDVEEVVLGKGKVGEAGYGQVDGPGVKMWTMVWRKREFEESVDEVFKLNELGMDND
ncbi:hypothetical protein VE01_07244 [Pseudogymnoascus verrucosus]|uniref:N-acetyltransferase domain-containing protein n=1 Tax=Pseudogymnoascus verrucosus TaxID=342668 RepID=A0A1B8GF54_9PEZI|nr:uncharacterized protein VE01_07244 [Pseudogymnoascus verrucosus]OBT94469.1 hypothetical protein VE01_07244 [Pseudogymnoascus verrucosus]